MKQNGRYCCSAVVILSAVEQKIRFVTNLVCMQGGDDEDGEGGGLDIGALLGNLGPLIGGLSGVSLTGQQCHLCAGYRTVTLTVLIRI
jgi:hypothetical protein